MDQLAENTHPVIVAVIAANPISGNFVVTMFANADVLHAAQHFHHIANPEVLIDAIDTRQGFARLFRGIKTLGRVEADIAVTTWLIAIFAKIIEQYLAATSLRFSKRAHGGELVAFNLFLRAIGLFIEHTAQPVHVGRVVQHHGFSRQTITPCATSFLIVGFNVAWNIKMHHKAHVGFINPHAKRHGRHHNLQVITLKRFLHPSALIGIHPCMVTGGANVVAAQLFSEHFHFFTAATIDDAALPALSFQITNHL
ncbi:Uncharacterised protein [Vibrio cholerae]|nr:Uncharacterised protein [Vibrio cholerae]